MRSLWICSAVLAFTAQAEAQFGGRAGPPPPPVPFRGMSPPPVIMPATVTRQSALPLIAPPISPIMNRHQPIWGTFGGFAYYPTYGYSQPNIIINYNYTYPEPYVPPRNFAVPPPAPNAYPNLARLTLSVPAGAEVYLAGKKIEMGTQRTFESPELKPGESYTFDVRVTWKENGKDVEEKRSLSIQAGELQSLQYIALPPTPVRLEK